MRGILLVAAILFSIESWSAFNVGDVTYGGNGCPAGSAAVTLTPDGSTLSLLFDSFIAEAGSTTGRRVDRKSCNLRIPMHVDAGFSVALIKTDYRGFNAIPTSRAYTQFSAEYFFAGSQGPKYTQKFLGPQAEDFIFSNEMIATDMTWSPCGEDVIFAVNASALAMADSSMNQTMMIVDSADLNKEEMGLHYSFVTRSCAR